MADTLVNLKNLVKMGPDMIIEGLAGLIDGVGTGMEWTGEQVEKLGELEKQFADSVRQLRKQKKHQKQAH